MEKYDPKTVRRNRALAWDYKNRKPVYTSDLMDEGTGKVLPDLCVPYGVKPAEVVYLTVLDLPQAYRDGVKSAMTAWAKEVDMTPDDAAWALCVAAAMQRLANDSVRLVRPVTDKAKDRAASVLRKVFEAQGKSADEIDKMLEALMK